MDRGTESVTLADFTSLGKLEAKQPELPEFTRVFSTPQARDYKAVE